MIPIIFFYRGVSGSVLISLKNALWALHWSFKETFPPCAPPWIPKWIFNYHGFRTLLWIVIIGADADTYGAIGGALLGAYHPYDIPLTFVHNIKMGNEITKCFQSIYLQNLRDHKSVDSNPEGRVPNVAMSDDASQNNPEDKNRKIICENSSENPDKK